MYIAFEALVYTMDGLSMKIKLQSYFIIVG